MDNQYLSITNDLHGANVLLAPNGKPSNLTPEQYFLVRTPEFKEWFGDWERLAMAKVKDPAMDEVTLANLSKSVSKVVDQNGEPLVVYHTTFSKEDFFSKFNIITSSDVYEDELGAHFGTLEQAKKIIDFENNAKSLGIVTNRKEGNPITKEFFLNLKNPMLLEDTKYWDNERFVKNIVKNKDLVFHLQKDSKDYQSWKSKFHYWWEKADRKSLQENIETLIEIGFDGIMYQNKYEGSGLSYATFRQNDIKLADGSNTTFDGSNPDIRFDGGGEVKNLEENYLKITSIKDKSIIKGSLDGFYINANFGRDGSIAWEIPYSQIEEGKKDNPNYIIVQSIDRNKNLAYKGNEDSKGEGTKAIASLFNKYPSLQVIGYDDWAESGFWQKIGGSVDELHRQDFFNYFENKFGYNPDIRFDGGGEAKAKFGDKYPKNQFIQLNENDIEYFADDLFDLIQNAYSHLGGHIEFSNIDSFKKTDLNFWIASDIDDDPNADVLLGGKYTDKGIKITLGGQDGNRLAKATMVSKMKDLMKQKGFYTEMDEELAKKLKLTPIQDFEEITKVLDKKEIKNLGNGVYERMIGGKLKQKVLVGLPSGRIDKSQKMQFDLGGEIDMNSLSQESLKVIKSNYENSFGFYDFDWNTESERENFNQWLKDFEKRQFIKNLDKAIQHIESDIELKKKRKIVELKRKAFEELIIPVLGQDVLTPKLSYFEAMVLMNPNATIESIEKGFQQSKNIIDEDGSINESKITPHPLFQEDSINAVAFETFVQQNPDYIEVYNDWKKLFDEEIELSLQDTYAFRYPSLEELEKLRLELLMLNRKKANKGVFNLGGKVQNDLDAYEEAMGESFFDDGGKAPIKKVYVSIRLRYDIEKVDWEYYYKYKENPFLELMSGTLDGIKGVSSSSNNIAEWFTTRDALIVMNYQDFANINNIQVIDYENIDELMANDLFIFRRLYNNLNEYDESESQLSRVIIDSLSKIGKNISRELNLLIEVVDKQKAKEVYRIERFLNPSETSAFWKWIESNQIKIDSAISFTKAIIDFNKIDDNYLGYGFPNPTITIEDLLPSVENGIRYSSKIYESEQEIIMLDRKLNIPKGSQLFFKNQTSESNRNDLIKSYKLDNRYKIYFVDNEDLERFRIKLMEKQEQVFKDRMYKGMMDLEEKKRKVLQDLLQKFLDNTYTEIEKIIEKDMLEYAQSKTFLNYDRDMEYQWYELPPIKKVLSEYEKIVRQEWEILESNKVKDLDLYKFMSFEDQAHQRIKEYLKENEQEIEEELYNYKTATNYYISLGLFKYDLVKSLYDYENLPQWFSYKDLSEMYLQKMGVDIYRYYDKKELKLVSQYEVGGKIN